MKPTLAALLLLPTLAACAPGEASSAQASAGAGPSGPASPSGPGATTSAPALATPTASGPTLVVDDAKAANPALQPTALLVPPGFGLPARSLRAPAGVRVSVLAAGLPEPRFMAFDAEGNLLVGTRAGGVFRLPARGGAVAPAPTPPPPLLAGLDAPTSVALHQGWLYVGETTRITRHRYDPKGPLGASESVVSGLPAGGHNTRTVAFGPDGKLYVAVGSSCNVCEEGDERRAAVLRYDADGSGHRRFAYGLRNPVGLAFQPGTGALWAAVNERDRLGDEVPPDLVTRVEEGSNHGWPGCLPPLATPQSAGADCGGVTPPTVAIQAHSAPLGIAFAEGLALPAPHASGLFVAQHGSWNRRPPAEPKLLHLSFNAQGQPVAARDFVTGWQLPDGQRWGRPVGVLPAPDGSLIVSDDEAGLLYAITKG